MLIAASADDVRRLVSDTSRVEIARIDPRDETWEVDLPRYRVYFWDAEARSDEYELSGAEDVAEVIRWPSRTVIGVHSPCTSASLAMESASSV
jgi:hypothetical protein